MEDTRPLRLLSLDGGGIRGLSSLYILKAIMRALEKKVEKTNGTVTEPAHRQLKPCEYFDLIGGTSTGGLIAVMLGTLRMDIDTCINEYLDMAPEIFPVEHVISGSKIGQFMKVARGKQRFNPLPLEVAVKRLVKKHLADKATKGEDTPFKFDASRDNKSPQCKVFVCVTSEKLGEHFRFRSYESSWNDLDDCPIWQACRATSAAPTFFPPMIIGKPPTAYVDGGMGYNNPIRLLLEEARHIWQPAREISCIVSIGTGVLASKDIGKTIKPLFESLKDMATDTEKAAREFREEMKHKYGVDQKVYFRFNVQRGLEQIGLEEWEEMDRTKIATQKYTADEWSQIEACASQLQNPIAPAVQAKPVFMVPFDRDGGFVGREDIISKIQQFHRKQRRIALFGIGGVGKSQIAIEYAYRFKDLHSQVFWVHAANNSRFDQAYQDIAKKLCLPDWEKPETDTRRLVYEWLSDEDHGRWLMILDNADDAEMFFPKTVSDTPSDGSKAKSVLASYIPRSPKGTVLITTRNRNLGKDLADGATPIEIQPFAPQEAEVLLKSKLRDDEWNAADAGPLLETLGYIPLAITQAAAFIDHYDMSLKDYLAALNKNDSNLKDYLSEELQDPRREIGSPNSVFRTWKLSFDQITRQKPRAAEMLSLMAVLDRQSIPEMLLRRDDEQDIDFVTALGTLKAFSLITEEKSGAIFGMHRLVQLSTQKWLELQLELLKWQERALDVVFKCCPRDSQYENWRAWEAINPHVEVVLEYAFETESSLLQRASILNDAGCYDRVQGRLKPAYQKTKEALATRGRVLEMNHHEVLQSIGNLASVLADEGKYGAAEEMIQQALVGYEISLEREDPYTLTILNNLAIVLDEQGKYEEAEKLHQQALNGREKTLGKEHLDTLISMNNLAWVLRDQYKYEKAEEMIRQALNGTEKALGKGHLGTLRCMNNLALVLRDQYKYEKAEKLLRQVLNEREKILGKEHPSTLSSMNNLAAVLSEQDKYGEAEKLHQQALNGCEKIRGKEHPETLKSMDNFALVLKYQGKYEEAEKLHRQALNECEKTLGKDHPDTLRSMNNLALVLKDQGKYEEAEKLHRQALNGSEKRLGKDHPDTLISVGNLAQALRGQGKYDDASLLYQRACAGLEKAHGPDHPQTLHYSKKYSEMRDEMRKREKA